MLNEYEDLPEPIEADWLTRDILGDATIDDLIRLGMLEPSPKTDNPFSGDVAEHATTPLGAVALRDLATVLDLSDLHDSTRSEREMKEYSPCRREFESLAELCRKMLIEVIALRGKVATLKAIGLDPE